MTLVIARVNEGKIYILGDTALTDPKLNKINPFTDGCLKQYKITDQLAIAFAGNTGDFEIVAEKIFSAKSAMEIINVTIEAQKNEKDFELLIGEVGYGNIRIIKDGKLTETLAGYIGDKSAFENFQRYFHANRNIELNSNIAHTNIYGLTLPEPIEENQIYITLYKAFKKVIIDKRSDTVAGIIVPLCVSNGKFEYLNYIDATTVPLNVSSLKRDSAVTLGFGTVEQGDYAIEFSALTTDGNLSKNIGYYFLQGGFGVLFRGEQARIRMPEIVYAKNPAYWVLETTKILGSGIVSEIMTIDHCGIAGEELLRQERASDALFCDELKNAEIHLLNRLNIQDRYIAGYAMARFNYDNTDRSDIINMLENFIKKYTVSIYCIRILRIISNVSILKIKFESW